MGTDDLGRDVMTQFIWGSRISLLVGLAATLIAMLIGSAVGISAGFFGGWVESILMRITEWFLVIPFLPLAIALAAVLGPSIRNIIIVIGITSWPSTTRLIHAQVLTLKERDYVDRSRALGASNWHLMTRHILPNAAPLILANTTLTVPIVILSEATLSFLGLGDPIQRLVGTDARRRLRGGRGHARGVVVPSCRRASGSWLSCWPSPWSARRWRRSSTRVCETSARDHSTAAGRTMASAPLRCSRSATCT